MARIRIIIVTLMFLIVAESSSNACASFVLNFRKVVRFNSSPATQNSPLPSPVSGVKESNSSRVDAVKSGKEKSQDPQVTNNKTIDSATPPIDKQTDKGQSHEGKDKGGGTKDSQLGSTGSCEGLPKSCRIQNTMLACIQASEKGSKHLVILVQNEGERTLKVSITNPTTVDNALQPFEIPSHQNKKINISVTEGKTNKIVLNAENGDCTIQMGFPTSGKNFFQQLSFYSKQVIPIYGVYLFLVALIVGGTWTCCKLRKRRWQGGVPYQELEMGVPESASAAVNVESTEGWEQDWDAVWDEDKAVKSPGGRHVGSISANGLTSRSSTRDGWEVDWEN